MFSSQHNGCWQGPPRPDLEQGVHIHQASEIEPILEIVVEEMSAAAYTERDIFSVRLALEEAIVNGLKHGNRGDPGKAVTLQIRVTAECVLAEIEDGGAGFDPAQVPDPLAPENLERASGRGLFLIRSYMTWIHYNERGNHVTMCRYRTVA